MEGKKTKKYDEVLAEMEPKEGGILLDDTELEEGIYSKHMEKSRNSDNLGVNLDQFEGSGVEKSFKKQK